MFSLIHFHSIKIIIIHHLIVLFSLTIILIIFIELFHIDNPTGNVLQILAYYDSVHTPKIKWFLTLREDNGEMETFPKFRSVDDVSSLKL